jgi:pyruvate kinase
MDRSDFPCNGPPRVALQSEAREAKYKNGKTHMSPASTSHPRNLTTIVATLGPASESPEMVRSLIRAGVGVFRLNFSHGDLDGHAKRLRTVREVAASLDVSVACLGDLQGPKIRVGRIGADVGIAHPSGGGAIDVLPGQEVVLSREVDTAVMRPTPQGVEPVLAVTYKGMIDEIKPGDKVLINDGAVRMIALGRDAARGELRCRVVVGGRISSGKGINLPDTHVSIPAVTERDWECARWGVANEIDYLALSFVRDAADVEQLRAGVCVDGVWVPIIAKIEMPEAVANLESIIEVSDGIMVARGDLGVEMDIPIVPIAQKRIVSACRAQGKPCIVATQMLETMIENSQPTRAEASDVANAIFEGTDAVMLSGETAVGRDPVAVVEIMSRIVAAAEAHLAGQPQVHNPPTRLAASHRGTAALAHGTWHIAKDLSAKAVVCWSQNGGTARYLSQNRFSIPIVAYSSSPAATRQMALLRGVNPVLSAPPASGTLSEWNAQVDEYLLSRGLAANGEAIVLLAGRPLGIAKRTNTLAIHKVGEPLGFSAHRT